MTTPANLDCLRLIRVSHPGALVGGASLTADFVAIVRAFAESVA